MCLSLPGMIILERPKPDKGRKKPEQPCSGRLSKDDKATSGKIEPVRKDKGTPTKWCKGLLYQTGRFAHGVDALSEGCRVSLHPFPQRIASVLSGLFFHHSTVNFHDG